MTGRELPPGPGRDLVDLLRRLRAARGLSLHQVADQAGLSAGYVSEIFNGRKTPRPPALARIVAALRGGDQAALHAQALAERQAELDRFHRGRPPPPSAPAPISGLPRAEAHFTGRVRELRLLTEALGGGQSLGVIYGMAGSGKTALAVRAAAAIAAHYPDGVIFLDLHGAAADRSPLPATDGVDRLLRRLRVDAMAIPTDPDERVAYYRDALRDRRILLLLDDAYDSNQVRPLLPAGDSCAVLITSRRRLAALDEALVVPVDVLTGDEGAQLFRAVAGADRIRGQAAAEASVRHIVDLCGRLPLAIRIAASLHRTRDRGTLVELETRLADEEERLNELDDGDRSVNTSLQVSVDDLSPALARTFALLAANPGRDTDALATAALTDQPPAPAARHLAQLAAQHLIVEHAAGRFRFHDLVAAFARRYATKTLRASQRSGAQRRLTGYFLRAAEAADALITPHRYRIPLETADRAAVLPQLRDHDAAFAWLTVEEANLVDVCLAAGDAGLDIACWQLAYTLRGYFFLAKSRPPWTATHTAALAATRRLGDVRAEAMTLNNLGMAGAGSTAGAAAHYHRAEQLFEAVGDAHGVHTARANQAWLRYGEHRFAEFLTEMRPVLDYYRQTGAHRNMAITLRGIGLAEGRLGRYDESIAHLLEALDAFTSIRARLDIAMTWNALGETYQRSGEPDRAIAAFDEALTTSAQAGSEFELARAHQGLGALAEAAGDRSSAASHWAQALDRFRRLGVPEAADVQRALDELNAGTPAGPDG
jgi:tetratricopeptide (TPR) repeat protein/transcriptional regulator with XRE-family HTH domain